MTTYQGHELIIIHSIDKFSLLISPETINYKLRTLKILSFLKYLRLV